MYRLHGAIHAYGGEDARATADSVISALSPAAWYRNATDVVSSGGFASIWADYASSDVGLVLPGVTGNYASTPNSAGLEIAGDIDAIVKVSANDWTPAADVTLASRYSTSGTTRSWIFTLGIGGSLKFSQSLDGTAVTTATSSANVSASDGDALWVRATRASASGTVKFYTSSDGSSWSQLGTDRPAASGALYNAAVALQVGAWDNALTLPGRIYRAIIKSGIDGTTVFDADFSAQAIGTASFTESSSNAATVTINTSGAAPAHIGKARDLLQGTGTNQPAYAAGVFTFDGADNYMKTGAFTLNQPTHLFVVVKQNAWAAFDAVFDGGTNSSGLLYQRTATPNLAIYALANLDANPDPAIGDWAVMSVQFNGSSSIVRTNDNAAVTGNAGANNMGGITLGATGTAVGSYGAVSIKEFVVFDAALSEPEASSVITALNNALTVF